MHILYSISQTLDIITVHPNRQTSGEAGTLIWWRNGKSRVVTSSVYLTHMFLLKGRFFLPWDNTLVLNIYSWSACGILLLQILFCGTLPFLGSKILNIVPFFHTLARESGVNPFRNLFPLIFQKLYINSALASLLFRHLTIQAVLEI